MDYHSVLLLKIFLAMAVFVLIFVAMFGFKHKTKQNDPTQKETSSNNHPPDAPHS